MMRIINILGCFQMTGPHCPCPSSVSLEYLILMHLLYAAAVVGQNDKATCSVSPVKLGQDVVLTCHFPEDLSVTKKDFTVYRYTHPNNPDAVIDCWWMKGKLDCYTLPGYIYNKNIGRHLNVTVPQVQPAVMGTYACQVAGYGPNSIETCELHATANTCSVSKTNSSSQASLRCFFNEDIGKTKKDFSVYKHSANKHNLTVVLACRWEDGKPKCDVGDGYLFNYQVSVDLTVDISHEATNEPWNYSCSHSGSKSNQSEACEYLFNKDNNFEEKLPLVVAIVLSSVFVLVVFLLLLAVMLYKRKKQRRRDIICSEGEGQRMISIKSKTRWEITKEFQNYLDNEIHGMFPNILNTFYFVPPVYFNKIKYKKKFVADEVIYILDPHDPADFRQDQAMQHVFHCLRHMAEHGQEQMFVLTQFRYEDYLNSPDSKYNKHKLPVPDDLKEADKRTKCFDLLIFHRSLGVLIAVVKPVSGDGQDDQQKLASLVVLEVSEAIQQLTMANLMVKHLMSDQHVPLIIRHALIMPNLTSSSLGDAINTDSEVVQNLLNCLGATREENIEDLCLCAEHLSKPDTPWDVSSEVVSNLQRWFKKIMKIPVLDESSYEKFYVSMIARFCGPATKSSLTVPNASTPFVLPKTLDEAVFLTGQMFERTVLNSDMAELLNSKKRFLYGPPNTGKTRMLTLVGKKWLSSGNDVFIVKDESSKGDSFLSEHLQALAASNTKLPARSTFGSVYTETCTLKQKTTEIIDRIKIKTEKKGPLVLLDDLQLQEQNFKIVLETLLKEFQNLWVTSVSRHTCPVGLPESFLTCCLNCPPATLREAPFADRVYGKNTGSNEASQHIFLTDGPPVKYIYHNKTVTSWVRSSVDCGTAIPWSSTSRECKECGLKVGEFLTKTLLIRKSDLAKMETHANKSLAQVEQMAKSRSFLHFRDILIVFECEGKKDNFLMGLRESGIAVNLLQLEKDKVVATDDDDTALALTVGQMQMFRAKRKIVVYVESDSECKDVENKQRAITSCTSQLIVVRVKQNIPSQMISLVLK